MAAELQQTIVIAGTMNPGIHHPSWYQSIGAASENEVEKAMSRPDLVVTPQITSTAIGPLVISCLPDRWNLGVSSPDDEARAIETAKMAFDALNQTPVKAFGLNYQVTAELQRADQRSVGSLMERLPFAGRVGGIAPLFETVLLSYPLEPFPADSLGVVRVLRCKIAMREELLQIEVNMHHEIPSQGAVEHFDLGRLLVAGYKERQLVQEHVDHLIERIDSK